MSRAESLTQLDDLPEVLEGRVNVKAPAVHVSNVGGGQLHFGDGQACFVILARAEQSRAEQRHGDSFVMHINCTLVTGAPL